MRANAHKIIKYTKKRHIYIVQSETHSHTHNLFKEIAYTYSTASLDHLFRFPSSFVYHIVLPSLQMSNAVRYTFILRYRMHTRSKNTRLKVKREHIKHGIQRHKKSWFMSIKALKHYAIRIHPSHLIWNSCCRVFFWYFLSISWWVYFFYLCIWCVYIYFYFVLPRSPVPLPRKHLIAITCVYL